MDAIDAGISVAALVALLGVSAAAVKNASHEAARRVRYDVYRDGMHAAFVKRGGGSEQQNPHAPGSADAEFWDEGYRDTIDL